ncbi:MAG TPA: DUF4956 domain-containing protein [Bacteroidia bacterium]|nr:DUF4956 domain-containing protein [Bacteroidia bacterium]
MENINFNSFISDNFAGFSPRDLPNFIFSFIVSALLAFILSKVYIKYGNALSNRKAFARNFVVLAIATMFIISVVKSSLALSLGLVGALSIVRFRSAIKEPEELTYLFLTIAIGLGCGAGLTLLTTIAFIGFVFFIWLNSRTQKALESKNLYLTLSASQPDLFDLKQVVEVLKKYCTAVKLKRTDETQNEMEASFMVEVEDFNQLQLAKEGIKSLNKSIAITFMDNSRDF